MAQAPLHQQGHQMTGPPMHPMPGPPMHSIPGHATHQQQPMHQQPIHQQQMPTHQQPIDYQEQQRVQVQEQQKQLLMQLLQLTPEQIAALPIEQQNQILMLKQQVLGNN